MNEQVPTEWVSIRQVWLRLINDVTQALVNFNYNKEKLHVSGENILSDAVESLFISLVDYGDASIKNDVEQWRKKYIETHTNKDGVWYLDKNYCTSLFSYILKTLNKYGMLFDTKPNGFTNVVMTDAQES